MPALEFVKVDWVKVRRDWVDIKEMSNGSKEKNVMAFIIFLLWKICLTSNFSIKEKKRRRSSTVHVIT